MALPEDIVTVTTATWSDHKNQPHGPVQRVTSLDKGLDNGTFYNLGSSIEYVGTEYSPAIAQGRFVRVRFFCQRTGSPTGNLQVFLYPNVGNAPDFNTLLAASQTYPVSSIPTSGKNEVLFTFQVPYNVAIAAYYVVLKISAAGDASNHVKIYRDTADATQYSGSRPFASSTWTRDTGLMLTRYFEFASNDFYAFGIDKTNNKVRLYKTSDVGATWAEQNSAGAPTIASTATLRSIYVQRKVEDFIRTWVLVPISTTGFRWYWVSNDVWQTGSPAPTNVPVTEIRANVSGQAPYGGGVSAGGALSSSTKATVVWQGSTETNMGSPWRRFKMDYYTGGGWSSVGNIDVVGSANTPSGTLPGVGIHFDLRWAGMDPLGHTHIIYSKSDTSTLQYRKFKADGTFTTINTMNGAVASATANYPVGQPTFYYQAPDWFIAVPYIDNTSNTLKIARCNVTSTETSGNWTITEAVAASAETSTSNPAVLTTEDLQGNKLLLWRVTPTTKTLNFTHDAGSNTWATEVPWRTGQVVEGISAQPMEDGGGLMYLDTAPATDELRYDRL